MAQYYTQVNNNYYDEESNYFTIDAWQTDDDNEEGKVVAVVNATTQDVFYIEPMARYDENVTIAIQELKERITNEKNA